MGDRYNEAVKGWPGSPPEGVVAPACFKVVLGMIVKTEGTLAAAKKRLSRFRY